MRKMKFLSLNIQFINYQTESIIIWTNICAGLLGTGPKRIGPVPQRKGSIPESIFFQAPPREKGKQISFLFWTFQDIWGILYFFLKTNFIPYFGPGLKKSGKIVSVKKLIEHFGVLKLQVEGVNHMTTRMRVVYFRSVLLVSYGCIVTTTIFSKTLSTDHISHTNLKLIKVKVIKLLYSWGDLFVSLSEQIRNFVSART